MCSGCRVNSIWRVDWINWFRILLWNTHLGRFHQTCLSNWYRFLFTKKVVWNCQKLKLFRWSSFKNRFRAFNSEKLFSNFALWCWYFARMSSSSLYDLHRCGEHFPYGQSLAGIGKFAWKRTICSDNLTTKSPENGWEIPKIGVKKYGQGISTSFSRSHPQSYRPNAFRLN